MFYRVDYMLAVLLLGFFVGFLLWKVFENIAPSRVGGGYYVAVAAVLLLRTGVFTCSMLISQQSIWGTLGGIAGDLNGLLFGVLFGLAVRRKDARTLLTDASVLGALCMGIAFTFALAGVGKAFSMTPMTEFFIQSGYSVSFLKFIVIAEIFGAIGVLLPWAFLPSLLGLTVDMFGAVGTHIHNGDPLNDNTGAIGLLIRLAAVGVLWLLSRRPAYSVRRSMMTVAAAVLICLVAAVGGSTAVRHASAAPMTHTSQ
jgi:uncharacterized membrane protein YphA (DoxX/SURF4 family)